MSDLVEILGKTIAVIEGAEVGNDRIMFTCEDGCQFIMYHSQDCCESVALDDICGDLNDLIGSPLVRASQDISNDNPPGIKKEYQDSSFTWSFYNLATAKGHVTLRWYGESNGYYSESVNFERFGALRY